MFGVITLVAGPPIPARVNSGLVFGILTSEFEQNAVRVTQLPLIGPPRPGAAAEARFVGGAIPRPAALPRPIPGREVSGTRGIPKMSK